MRYNDGSFFLEDFFCEELAAWSETLELLSEFSESSESLSLLLELSSVCFLPFFVGLVFLLDDFFEILLVVLLSLPSLLPVLLPVLESEDESDGSVIRSGDWNI